jgi:hypothetical protein
MMLQMKSLGQQRLQHRGNLIAAAALGQLRRNVEARRRQPVGTDHLELLQRVGARNVVLQRVEIDAHERAVEVNAYLHAVTRLRRRPHRRDFKLRWLRRSCRRLRQRHRRYEQQHDLLHSSFDGIIRRVNHPAAKESQENWIEWEISRRVGR